MMRYLLARLFRSLITLLIVSLAAFVAVRLSGNPALTLLPQDATAEDVEAYSERMGLDQPLPAQYLTFLAGAVRGDFGNSLRTGRPVTELVMDRLPRSLLLATCAIIVAVAISLPLGVIAAVNRGRRWDRAAMLIAVVGQSVPTFLSGMLAILLFSVVLKVLPTSGADSFGHYILPMLTMGWFTSAGVTRLLRSSMLEVLDAEYVKFARAKGLAEALVVGKHALRNALIPVITFVGFMYGITMAASIATEVVFNIPGLGRLSYEAVIWRDYPLLQMVVLVWALLIVGLNFIVDVAYVFLDPRLRSQRT
jgi:peptide/nickel transport system permease protein